jgi:hypothetical protein
MVTGWLPEHSGAARHRAKIAMREQASSSEAAMQHLRLAGDA